MIAGTAAVLVFALIYWKALSERFRAPALLLAGVVAFWAAAPSLGMSAGLVFAVLGALLGLPSPTRGRVATVLVLLVLALNKYVGVPAFQVIGLSYVAFRLISLTRDVEKRKQPVPGWFDALFYVLFPPTFLSGPIEPYERFKAAAVPASLSRDDLFASLLRLASGLGKKLLLVEPLRVFADAHFLPSSMGSSLWAGLFAYSVVVYLDFSAYSDLAIGAARLFGYTIGENFNWPYLSGSISEFWTRWHISLSQFLRDHVFLPFSARALSIRTLAPFPVAVGVMASLFTMTLCGMWHGDRASFVFWGLGHGVLLGMHQVYRQKLIGRMKAKARARLTSNVSYRTAATFLTFLLVSLLWVPFRFSLSETRAVYSRLFSFF